MFILKDFWPQVHNILQQYCWCNIAVSDIRSDDWTNEIQIM